MDQGETGLYNIVSIVFLVLTGLVFVISLLILGGAISPPAALQVPTEVTPDNLVNTNALLLPPTAQLQSTITLTPYPTQEPSATPSEFPTETATSTPTNTPTETPTITLSPTTTLTLPPSETPTQTFTPTPSLTPTIPTNTPTITPTPTNTPRPIEFNRDPNTPIYRVGINQLGCSWQGIGGNVISSSGAPLPGYQVRVTGSDGVALPIVTTGSNPDYGAAGWEVTTGNAPAATQYTVEILAQDGSGEPVSRAEQVNFPGSCDTNLAVINFVRIN